ncbi:hypothetical protein IFT54_12285 [Sphingomonas sp. CFBP 13714]|uniref:hypothetical protein n=1 Tax=Sphingomonas sp. CFBP 13714 TaxID=2775308 RepID=UPI001782380E|nr:hypothetical protein [Sphingomonas sp. CFBP 13714]MBD8700599.1 hypothetical protein [Sphingomonas sp. CFBP 13714]
MEKVSLAEWEAEYSKLAEAESDSDDEGGDPYSVGYIAGQARASSQRRVTAAR